jgi:hypothetical protein
VERDDYGVYQNDIRSTDYPLAFRRFDIAFLAAALIGFRFRFLGAG